MVDKVRRGLDEAMEWGNGALRGLGGPGPGELVLLVHGLMAFGGQMGRRANGEAQ